MDWAGHPRFNASKYYVEVLWEPQLVNEPDNNSYDDYGSQMIGNESDGTSDNQKSDGWDDFLKTAVLHIMQIIVEVLLS